VQVNIFEAKNRLSQLIKSVQAGEEVVIANRGQPVARLVPAAKSRSPPQTPATPRPFSPGSSATPCPTMRGALPRRSMPLSSRKDNRGIDLSRCVPVDLSRRASCPMEWTSRRRHGRRPGCALRHLCAGENANAWWSRSGVAIRSWNAPIPNF
jgi:prevent-host-death family protein